MHPGGRLQASWVSAQLKMGVCIWKTLRRKLTTTQAHVVVVAVLAEKMIGESAGQAP
jgi:hypothetical protein